ncbi:MAG TPA: TetR/AcrR family transcriptional regulator [Caulobacteraceae bacterium]|nr:TetR/AcrR family transcriptional regulator [Caulobacteraceae bacterium]
MPVFVDHEARRRQVVAVASRLIAEAGLDAVTVRDVAEAAECSTAIVSHYFHNKKELLLRTYHSSIERGTARCEAALAAADGDLKAYLAELMPLDEERTIHWKIWLAFWAKAIADKEIAALQKSCVLRTRGNIVRILGDLGAKGLLASPLDFEAEARRILTLIMGMAVQVMFDPADWPGERQHGLIDAELHKLYSARRAPRSVMAAPTHPRPEAAAAQPG